MFLELPEKLWWSMFPLSTGDRTGDILHINQENKTQLNFLGGLMNVALFLTELPHSFLKLLKIFVCSH